MRANEEELKKLGIKNYKFVPQKLPKPRKPRLAHELLPLRSSPRVRGQTDEQLLADFQLGYDWGHTKALVYYQVACSRWGRR